VAVSWRIFVVCAIDRELKILQTVDIVGHKLYYSIHMLVFSNASSAHCCKYNISNTQILTMLSYNLNMDVHIPYTPYSEVKIVFV